MKILSPIFNMLAVVYLILFSVSYLNLCKVANRDFDQARYDYAVKQATEAMFRSTLHAEDIGLDYTDMSYITIDASDALDVFDRVICANYDMAPSAENFSTIHDTINACLIAGYDGYYILQSSEVDSIENNGNALDGYDMKFSPKIPYFVHRSGWTYSFDFYQRTNNSMKSNSDASDKVNAINSYVEGVQQPGGMTDAEVLAEINKQVRSAILNESQNPNRPRPLDINDVSFIFPTDTTLTGVNPFSIPGIFMITGDSSYASVESMKTYSVSGYKAIKRTRIVAFTDTRTGRAYYCYETQLRDEEKDQASGGSTDLGYFHIDNYFDSVVAACKEKNKNGYYYSPYFEVMTRKIDTSTR